MSKEEMQANGNVVIACNAMRLFRKVEAQQTKFARRATELGKTVADRKEKADKAMAALTPAQKAQYAGLLGEANAVVEAPAE